MNEKYVFWSQQEDEVLRQLREERQITKWSLISQIMKRQFGVRGRNGKKCRERYENHLNPSVKRQEWTLEQEKRLMELHNLKGNKWVEISRELHRTDNSVKNHYHSKLRKAFRKINKCIINHLRNNFRPFKNNLLSKIIQTSEAYYSDVDEVVKERGKVALSKDVFNLGLKNKILQQVNLNQKQNFTKQQIQQINNIARQICEFNKHYIQIKSIGVIQKIPVNRYKGKQIINLLQENNVNQVEGQKGNNDMGDMELGEQGCETPLKSQIVEGNTVVSPISKGSINIGSQNMNRDLFNNIQTCDFPYFQNQGSVSIFSGKASSFTSYKPSSSNSIQTVEGQDESEMADSNKKMGCISSNKYL